MFSVLVGVCPHSPRDHRPPPFRGGNVHKKERERIVRRHLPTFHWDWSTTKFRQMGKARTEREPKVNSLFHTSHKAQQERRRIEGHCL